MNINEKALEMLQAYPLCDNCLGRQFALLGRGLENSRRGNALKLNAVLQASAYASLKEKQGIKILKLLATSGFSTEAQNALKHLKKRVPKNDETLTCFLCENRFAHIDDMVTKILSKLAEYEFSNFLVGIELLPRISEREDEFKAKFNLSYSESIKHEFGRIIGKAIESKTAKPVEFLKPDVMIIINPFTEHIKLQINPLFIAGRYRKLVRDISQSIWICSACRGKGCKICNGTGKYYAESVEELVSKPVLIAAQGVDSFFHASGREDVDALMLGTGRPFVIEISKPKKRTIDLKEAKNAIN
ncbi:MAG: tRNA pseudouridine(54/55) synthase Pus10, partial [Crenarchaeota archaeon]|nr:tRNA pseudouridine(54/55) synthase Pus10 [Thermoproteota archaeon]